MLDYEHGLTTENYTAHSRRVTGLEVIDFYYHFNHVTILREIELNINYVKDYDC